MEIGDDPEKEFQRVGAVQASGDALEVFLTSESCVPNILINAMRAGAREFFQQPINDQEVRRALAKFKGRTEKGKPGPISEQNGKIIVVLGAKGGVGTTTVAVNLAANLVGLEGASSAVLMDLSPLLGEVPLFLNAKPVFDWMEIGKNVSRLDGTYLMSVLLKHSSGIHVLSSPATPLDGHVPQPGAVAVVLALLRKLFDFIVIDGGRCCFDDTSKVILKAADKVLLVANPTLPCIVNLGRLIDSFQTLGYSTDEGIEIVFNRSTQEAGISPAQAEEALSKKVSWLFPNDYRTAIAAINNGEPLTVVARGSELNTKIAQMAAAFAGKAAQKGKRGLFSSISIGGTSR
jgi:pilus assembly protein CpaE